MKRLIVLLSFVTSHNCFGQAIDLSNYQKQYVLPIFEKKSEIKLDGDLNDLAWQIPDTASNFWMKFPKDDYHPTKQTVVKTCYDSKALYFGITVYDSKPFIGQSLKRDSRIRENDGITLIIDPINKKTNGFYFSVTAFNVQADDLISTGEEDLTYSWDAKWYSETKQYDDRFTVEIAIPFKALRYNSNNLTWGVNIIRSCRKDNEFHSWTRIPVNFRGTNIGYLGALKWDKAPPNNGANIVAIPYINQTNTQNNLTTKNINGKFNAGLDAKIAVSNSLNVDLTINPDFSQVDVDRQVTNLSRFSIFFPERRNFFLENSDLITNYGTDPIRPFYSRTIGLTPNGQSVPIVAGARLSGNLSSKLRTSFLNMQTAASKDYAAQNYTALSLNRQVLKRSVVSGYFLNRDGFYTDKNKLDNAINKYGRNAGGEFSYSSNTGKYVAWAGFHTSMKPTISNKNNFIIYGGEYNVKLFKTVFEASHVGKNYYTDMGFVERIASKFGGTDSIVRNGFNTFFMENRRNCFPKKGKVNQHSIDLQNFVATDEKNKLTEYNAKLRYNLSLKNTAFVSAQVENNNITLAIPIEFTDGLPLPVGTYRFTQATINTQTDSRGSFTFGASYTGGGFYNGTLNKVTARAIYRKQPYLTVEVNAEFNNVKLPAPYTSENLFLISPRVEINFSNKLFWTNFLQYNTQANNININSRLQWRYKPASDIFIVYTDNYFTDPFFTNKNRALVLKMNYWLNL
jgi:hypothetical protein